MVANESVDAEGFRVKDYYNPPTSEDCISRYESTTTQYSRAIDDYNVPLEMQSGTVNQACNMDSHLFVLTLIRDGILLVEDCAFDLMTIIEEQMSYETMIYYRSFPEDYRDEAYFKLRILQCYNNRQRQARQRRRCVCQINTMWYSAEYGVVLTHDRHYSKVTRRQTYSQSFEAFNLIKQLHAYRKLEKLEYFSSDLNRLISTFTRTDNQTWIVVGSLRMRAIFLQD